MPEPVALFVAALQYPCPHCSAAPQKPCVLPSGRKAVAPHGERLSNLTDSDRKAAMGTLFGKVLQRV